MLITLTRKQVYEQVKDIDTVTPENFINWK